VVDTKPLLKGFGAAADVARQIATDKAVNSRRTRSNTFDIAQGQLIEEYELTGSAEHAQLTYVPHSLGRVPKGVLVLKNNSSSFTTSCDCVDATIDTVKMRSQAFITVTLWVV